MELWESFEDCPWVGTYFVPSLFDHVNKRAKEARGSTRLVSKEAASVEIQQEPEGQIKWDIVDLGYRLDVVDNGRRDDGVAMALKG